jgi:hypothetical protein
MRKIHINNKPIFKTFCTKIQSKKIISITNYFPIMINSPFYISTIALGIYTPNSIDAVRLTSRCLIYSQAILSGSNVTKSISKYKDEIQDPKPLDFGKNMALSVTPTLTTFAFSHYLINSSVLTLSMLNFGISGIISSQILNLIITRKLGDTSNINTIACLINIVFVILFYIFVYEKIKAGVNPFKRKNDPNRLEDLLNIEKLKEEDIKMLDEDNAFFFETLTEEQYQEVAEMFNKELK